MEISKVLFSCRQFGGDLFMRKGARGGRRGDRHAAGILRFEESTHAELTDQFLAECVQRWHVRNSEMPAMVRAEETMSGSCEWMVPRQATNRRNAFGTPAAGTLTNARGRGEGEIKGSRKSYMWQYL